MQPYYVVQWYLSESIQLSQLIEYHRVNRANRVPSEAGHYKAAATSLRYKSFFDLFSSLACVFRTLNSTPIVA